MGEHRPDDEDLVDDDLRLGRILQLGSRRVAIHAEDEPRLKERKAITTSGGGAELHPVWRDAESAILATKRLLRLARQYGRRVHVLHVTTAEEIELLAQHKDLATVEVTPQHLTLAAPDCYQQLGSYAQMNPPIRDQRHRDGLWAGLRAGVFDAVKSFAEHHALLPRGVQLRQEDVTGRMSFVLSTRLLDPQFQGQVKEKLNSREAVKLVSTMSRDPFEVWLNGHVEYGKAIAEMAAKAAANRLKSSQKTEKRKTSGVAVLPGKLSDAATDDPVVREIFLVEGDSAGGSAKQARDRETQAILPLRGKVMNSWETDPNALYANKEIHDIAVALGVERHSLGDNPDLTGLRYHKVVIMTDADVDGAHISTLLLTLFFRHFPKLVEQGHIYVAQPPLYRVDAPAKGKKPARRQYALDDGELVAIKDRLALDGIKPEAIEVGRFKGLGEMNPSQLRETAMDPATRRVLPVLATADEMHAALKLFDMLMGKSAAADRRDWMEAKGNLVEADV